MKEALHPFDEHKRLEELRRYEVLDTAAGRDMDDVTRLAASICKTPIAFVSLLDETREWFMSKVGIDTAEIPCSIAFGAHAILEKDVMIVPDVSVDDRFADNPLVTGELGIRFYAGVPLVSSHGYPVGTLCVIDRQPRNVLPEEKEALQILSRQVVHQLEQRCQLKELQRETIARQQAEQTVVASQKQLQQFLDTSNELIQRVGPDGRLLYTNAAWHQRLGYTVEEASRLTVFEILHPDCLGHCQALFSRLMAGESIPMMEISLVAKDGRRIEVVGSATCEMGENDGPVATRTIFHDVTEKKVVERAVRESEQRYRTLFESSRDAIMILAPPMWKFTSGNPATVCMFRTADEREFITFSPWDLSPERQPDGRLSSDKAREMIDIAMRDGAHYFEWTHLRRTGETFPATVLFTRMDINGHPQLQATVRDISEQKQAEDTLRNMNAKLEEHVRARTAELEQAYQQLNFHLQNTPLGVVQWAPDFKLLQWSAQAERILGWAAQEVEGKYPHEWPFILEEERPAMQEIMERLRSGQERRKVHRVRHCSKNGQEVHCVWHTSVMADELGQVRSMMALVQELSEQVQLERQFHQAQKMEPIGRLAGGVAHDFNNLLTVITGYSDLVLMNPKTDDAVKKAVEQILHAGNRATGLTRQLLAFSRQQVLQPRTLSLNATVTEAEKMLRRLIGEDVRLSLGLKAAPDTIKADPVQVEQIVMNLAVNARDAMPNGGLLSIETETVCLEEPLLTQVGGPLPPGAYVSLTVRDTGNGIDKATLTKIFEPFFTTKALGKGTGLGLATVHGIVQQSAGAIAVSSQIGQGTTFQVYFPCVEEAKGATKGASPATVIERGAETILLVEDEPTVRSFVHEVLATFGYTVLGVRTAEEAMFLSNGYEHPIQLLVTDVVLPLGRGTKLAEDLCRKRPDMKALLMSGYMDHGRIDDTALARQLPFIQKPFTSEVLLSKVQEVLKS